MVFAKIVINFDSCQLCRTGSYLRVIVSGYFRWPSSESENSFVGFFSKISQQPFQLDQMSRKFIYAQSLSRLSSSYL